MSLCAHCGEELDDFAECQCRALPASKGSRRGHVPGSDGARGAVIMGGMRALVHRKLARQGKKPSEGL